MDPATTTAAATELAAAVQAEAQAAGQSVEDRAAAKAPGLSTGAYAPGGYTYNRVMTPVVQPISSALVAAAKQALFRQAAKNAMNDAQVNYDSAKSAMNERQREAQRKAAEEARRRQAAYDAAIKQAQTVTAPAGGNSTVNSINKIATGAPATLRVTTAKPGNITSVGKAKSGNITSVGTAKSGNIISVGKAKSGNIR